MTHPSPHGPEVRPGGVPHRLDNLVEGDGPAFVGQLHIAGTIGVVQAAEPPVDRYVGRLQISDPEALQAHLVRGARGPVRCGLQVGGAGAGQIAAHHITSPFGNRLDPYYHVWQLHAGVDIGAAAGTPIVAAAAGRVSQAGWFGGDGNYTCIDHGTVDGQRLSTCYGHQQRIQVAPGEQVSAGQVIGLVGSTGASTGPHLHFEVRLGGRPVDPLPWL